VRLASWTTMVTTMTTTPPPPTAPSQASVANEKHRMIKDEQTELHNLTTFGDLCIIMNSSANIAKRRRNALAAAQALGGSQVANKSIKKSVVLLN
jgi:hypothetical protein